MLTRFLPKSTGILYLYLIFGALIISSWGLLITWQGSPFAERMGHESLANHHIPFASHFGTFLLGWLLMTAAMMLPASLPLLISSSSNNRMGNLDTLLKSSVYFSLWMVFGSLAFLGDNVLHKMTDHGAPLANASGFIAPTLILAAGIYQLTPLKRSFTERCKPSQDPGQPEHGLLVGGALKHGFWLGLNCIGSCWSLMLLMFALGHHRLDWMIILSGIITAERLMPWGSSLAKWVGIGLIAWGIFSMIIII